MRTAALLIMLLLAGCYRNPPEHNKIVFETESRAVQESIKVFVPMVDSLRTSTGIEYCNLNNEDSLVFFDSRRMMDVVSRPAIDTIAELRQFSPKARRLFLSRLQFLRSNHLGSCAFDPVSRLWFFHYRRMPVLDADDKRSIVAFDSRESLSYLRTRYTILEQKGELVLVADSGATIR